MKREKAKKELHYALQFGTLNPKIFIDKLYDAFENRSCRNCNHCSDDCDEDGEWYCEERFKHIELDFNCSKYELKQ